MSIYSLGMSQPLSPMLVEALGGTVKSHRKTSIELLSSDPWLMDFGRTNGSFEKSYDIFRNEPTLMSTALLRYVEQVYHEVSKEAWEIQARAMIRV